MIKVPARGVTVKGFDVSHYEPHFDFTMAKLNGDAFCFVKATEGISYKDPSFDSHRAAAKKAGLLCGAYHFFHPKYPGRAQATHFAAVVGRLGAEDLPCVLDWEVTDNVPAKSDIEQALLFLYDVKKLTGKNPIIYTGPYFAEALKLTIEFADYPLWIAHYGTAAPLVPNPWKYWTFWQYSENGLDYNLFNGPFDGLRNLLR